MYAVGALRGNAIDARRRPMIGAARGRRGAARLHLLGNSARRCEDRPDAVVLMKFVGQEIELFTRTKPLD